MHGIWTIIDAAILMWFWPGIRKQESAQEVAFRMIGVVALAAVLHGVYNALCVYSIVAAILFHAIAALVAFQLIRAFVTKSEARSQNYTPDQLQLTFQPAPQRATTAAFVSCVAALITTFLLANPANSKSSMRGDRVDRAEVERDAADLAFRKIRVRKKSFEEMVDKTRVQVSESDTPSI